MADAEALQKLRDENAAMEKEIMELTKKSDTVGTKSASISPPNSSIQVLKFEKGFSAAVRHRQRLQLVPASRARAAPCSAASSPAEETTRDVACVSEH